MEKDNSYKRSVENAKEYLGFEDKNNLGEFDTHTLLTQVELTMAKIAISANYPELHEAASESVQIIEIVRERMKKTLGNLAVKSSEEMLDEYLAKGGTDQSYIEYLKDPLQLGRD